MKVSLWYVLREFRRRPRRWLSLSLVSAAVMTVMVLMVLWMEAEWRADVMPDHKENYHFSFYNLTEADKKYISRQDWVQASYDLYTPVRQEAYTNEFRVRVTWDHTADAVSLVRQVMLQRGLFEREPYAAAYQKEYERQYNQFVHEWMGMTERNGITAAEAAAINARSYILRSRVNNTSFLQKTQNSYTMQPSFFSFLFMLALFLGAATTILTLETYRSSFSDFGTLRALGMNRRQIFCVNLLESLGVALAAIPSAILLTVGAVQLYYRLSAPYAESAGEVYFTIAHYVPLSTLALICLYLIAAALLGTLLVCWIYRTKSILSLLRSIGTFTVSFVSKTSTFFEHSHGVTGYSRLYGIRARASLLRYTAVIAIMLPLPMYYTIAAAGVIGMMDTPSHIVQGIYILFQAAAIMITALCVTWSASRMAARSRTTELGISRALGADRTAIRRITYPTAAAQSLLMLALAMGVNLFINGLFSTGNYINSTAGAVSVGEFFLQILLYSISAAVFVFPSTYGGLITFFTGFFRRPIMESIRVYE